MISFTMRGSTPVLSIHPGMARTQTGGRRIETQELMLAIGLPMPVMRGRTLAMSVPRPAIKPATASAAEQPPTAWRRCVTVG
jgi:hypothetical protein